MLSARPHTVPARRGARLRRALLFLSLLLLRPSSLASWRRTGGRPDVPYPGPQPGEPETPEPPVEPPTEIDMLMTDKTARWRCQQLLKAGMTLPQARALTFDRSVDVRQVVTWIEGGCDPSVAFDIVS